MTPRGSAVSWVASLVRNLFRGGRRDAELRSDIDTYVDMLVDEKIAAAGVIAHGPLSALVGIAAPGRERDWFARGDARRQHVYVCA